MKEYIFYDGFNEIRSILRFQKHESQKLETEHNQFTLLPCARITLNHKQIVLLEKFHRAHPHQHNFRALLSRLESQLQPNNFTFKFTQSIYFPRQQQTQLQNIAIATHYCGTVSVDFRLRQMLDRLVKFCYNHQIAIKGFFPGQQLNQWKLEIQDKSGLLLSDSIVFMRYVLSLFYLQQKMDLKLQNSKNQALNCLQVQSDTSFQRTLSRLKDAEMSLVYNMTSINYNKSVMTGLSLGPFKRFYLADYRVGHTDPYLMTAAVLSRLFQKEQEFEQLNQRVEQLQNKGI